MIDSVLAQTVDDWELILVDDCSPDPGVRTVLRRRPRGDPRIRVIERAANGHIVAASNDGIAAARGEFVALLDHDDLLAPRALEAMAEAIEAEPDVDYLYSDEDKIDDDGSFYDGFRKPEWSPERLRGQMYTGHLSVMRTTLVRDVGGFHQGFDGSQDHDLALRVTERARAGRPRARDALPLARVAGSAAGDPDAKPYAWERGVRAVQDHLERVGIEASAEFGAWPGTYRVRATRPRDPGQRGHPDPRRRPPGLGRAAVLRRRRRALAAGPRRAREARGRRRLRQRAPRRGARHAEPGGGPGCCWSQYTKPFNFSEKCNVGVTSSSGDVMVLLNDDIEVMSDGFLVQLVAPLFEPGVGHDRRPAALHRHHGAARRARLYRHAIPHMFPGRPETTPGPFGALSSAGSAPASTGGLRRDAPRGLRGGGRPLRSCCRQLQRRRLLVKVARAGYRLVWVADARAYHFESQTREAVVEAWERDLLGGRWTILDDDPFLPGIHGRQTVGAGGKRWRGQRAGWR